VNADWLTEVFRNDKQVKLHYCRTEEMAADIFTKTFATAVKWQPALDNINIIDIGPLHLTSNKGSKGPPRTIIIYVCRHHFSVQPQHVVQTVLASRNVTLLNPSSCSLIGLPPPSSSLDNERPSPFFPSVNLSADLQYGGPPR